MCAFLVHIFILRRKKKMKKGFSLLVVFTVIFSLTVISAAAGNVNKNSNTRQTTADETTANSQTTETTTTTQTKAADSKDKATKDDPTSSNGKSENTADIKKQFKAELNAQKKELQQEKVACTQQREDLEAQHEALVAAGKTEEAAALKVKLDALNTQIAGVQAQIKEIVNQRYMVVKAMYSDKELAQFKSAADLIAQMNQDAATLDVGSVMVNNNLIKFDTPPYIKGGRTMIPVRAITESLGADVTWDQTTKTATITKDNTVVKLTLNSPTVTVNGEPITISDPAEFACGRTYVPLRFLAETFHCDVSWDGDNELIDITDSGNAEAPAQEAN